MCNNDKKIENKERRNLLKQGGQISVAGWLVATFGHAAHTHAVFQLLARLFMTLIRFGPRRRVPRPMPRAVPRSIQRSTISKSAGAIGGTSVAQTSWASTVSKEAAKRRLSIASTAKKTMRSSGYRDGGKLFHHAGDLFNALGYPGDLLDEINYVSHDLLSEFSSGNIDNLLVENPQAFNLAMSAGVMMFNGDSEPISGPLEFYIENTSNAYSLATNVISLEAEQEDVFTTVPSMESYQPGQYSFSARLGGLSRSQQIHSAVNVEVQQLLVAENDNFRKV